MTDDDKYDEAARRVKNSQWQDNPKPADQNDITAVRCEIAVQKARIELLEKHLHEDPVERQSAIRAIGIFFALGLTIGLLTGFIIGGW